MKSTDSKSLFGLLSVMSAVVLISGLAFSLQHHADVVRAERDAQSVLVCTRVKGGEPIILQGNWWLSDAGGIWKRGDAVFMQPNGTHCKVERLLIKEEE